MRIRNKSQSYNSEELSLLEFLIWEELKRAVSYILLKMIFNLTLIDNSLSSKYFSS